MFAFANALASAALDAQKASHHAQTTLMVRIPLFYNALLSPSPEAAFEWNRAWAEKAAVTLDGAFAACRAIEHHAMQPANLMTSPFAAAETLLAISTAALRPAHKRVQANARRLGRKKSLL
jgi:hypothetical protein